MKVVSVVLFAGFVAADILAQAMNAISGVPSCSFGCIATLQGFQNTMTEQVITAVCSQLNFEIGTLTGCITSACPLASDLVSAKTAVRLASHLSSSCGFKV
ncbi:hypothetical protein BC830DRAFT_1136645 [Chytriomyces sp. MP71]|nr:hypothetical protein BC830DRAFT_1136645 [Chytriomyces sp. MP71]